MRKFRVIPRLEVKGDNVVKGIRMEGLRTVGKPHEMTAKYYAEGADEILFTDVVASLYNRNQLDELVSETAKNIHIPLCVGGGVRTIEDFRSLLRLGADKVSINTQACNMPEIITECAHIFGSQAVLISIQAKRRGNGKWEAYNQNGREPSGRDVVEWAKEVVERGAGEILLTSVDCDGTRKGLDVELIQEVLGAVTVPLLVGGGMSCVEDAIAVAKIGVSGIVLAHVLHFNRITIPEIKSALSAASIPVRVVANAEATV
jgi:cyclase